MTSLSDKVARVKERMKQAEPYREIWSNEFHVIDQQNAIIQKQREVLERIAKGQNEQGISDLARHLRAMAQDCLTAIDNVMNK